MSRRAERRQPRLPAGSVLAAIPAQPAIGWPRRGWTRRLRRYAGKGVAEAYRRAAQDGRVSLTTARACIDGAGAPNPLRLVHHGRVLYQPRATGE
jgi:hypothetical protein